MAVKASLVDFLKTGCIGPISIGMAMAEVERLAGPPEADGGLWWRYGSIELGFTAEQRCKSRLAYIQIEHPDHRRRFSGFRALNFRDELSPQRDSEDTISQASFARFAQQRKIQIVDVIRAPFISDGEFGLLTAGGVLAAFSKNEAAKTHILDTLITEFVEPRQTTHFPIAFARQATKSMQQSWRHTLMNR